MAFFKWRKSEPAPAREDDATEPPDEEQPEAEAALADADADDDGEPEVVDADVDEDAERAWRARAEAVVVGGASTGSKRSEVLYGPDADFGPTHFSRAAGCHVTTAAGATLIDCTMALGAVAIGYGDQLV